MTAKLAMEASWARNSRDETLMDGASALSLTTSSSSRAGRFSKRSTAKKAKAGFQALR